MTGGSGFVAKNLLGEKRGIRGLLRPVGFEKLAVWFFDFIAFRSTALEMFVWVLMSSFA